MTIRNPKFQIGDRVYHVTKESEQGVVIDAKYFLRTGNWIYEVSFTPGFECDLYEDELSESKVFLTVINIMLASKDEIEPMSEETAQEFNKMLNKYRGGILKDIENYLKLNVMNKEEAKEKLRRAESNLRLAEIISEEHEKAIKEIKEDIEKLKVIINKKDDWRLVEVPDDIWQALYEEKTLLMADMIHFAYVRNEGWVPDWGDHCESKCGLYVIDAEVGYHVHKYFNDFVFGIAVKSEEIAQEMLEEFGKRIEEIYNKQY